VNVYDISTRKKQKNIEKKYHKVEERKEYKY
jgi:hypothetical protein